MFTGMRAQNFKSWQDTGEIRLAPLTGFFGPNSSGKTSLLQMLLVWKQTVESADQNQILLTDGSYVNLGSVYDLLYQHHQTEPLRFVFTWVADSPFRYFPKKLDLSSLERSVIFASDFIKEIKFDVTIEAGDNFVQVNKFKYSFSTTQSELKSGSFGLRLEAENANGEPYRPIVEGYKLEKKASQDVRLARPVKSYQFPLEQRSADLGQLPRLWNQFPVSFEKQFQRIYYLGPLRENFKRVYLWTGEAPYSVGNRGEWAIPALIASRVHSQTNHSANGDREATLEELVASWLQRLGLIYTFRLRPIAEGRREYEVLVQVNEDAAEVSITDVGFGVSQVLPVLTLCYYVNEGATIILEQPELHLHPAVQAGLADVFIDAIKTRNIQIILESHSEHLLRRLQRRIAEEEFSSEDTALYFTSMADGVSQLQELDVDEYGNIRNWPANFFGDEMGELVAMTEAAMKRKMAEKQA